MSYTVEQIMERVRSESPGVTISYIQDAFMELGLLEKKDTKVKYYDIIEDEHQYIIPSEANAIVSVSVRNEADSTELLGANDMTFAGTPVLWTNVNFGTFGTVTDLSVVHSAANKSCYLNQANLMTVGKKYRLTYDATVTLGTFLLESYTNSDRYGEFVTGKNKVIEFEALETDKLKIVGISSAGNADFDNFSLKERGKVEYKRAKRLVGDLSEVWTDEEET